MNVNIETGLSFTRSLNALKETYGGDFQILNGFHESQMNFSDFLNAMERDTNKKIGDVTIDPNASVSHKDIATIKNEKYKPHDKLSSFNKIFYELHKKYGYQVANEWLTCEYTGAFYLHDAPSSSQVPYCYAYDLTRLAKDGLFFLDNYNNEPPKHLTTFLDDVIEYVSFMCNRSSGAVGLPNVLIWSFYFWKTDCENGYYIKDKDYYLRQCLQKLIYRLNQPFLRVDQSSFTNISIFDRCYVEELFGGVEFPDGTFAIDYVDDIIEVEKVFMEVVSSIRSSNMFTHPVLTYSLLYKDGKFVDEDFARWCSDHNVKWNDSNFFISDNVGVLSNCCFSGDQMCLTKSSDGINYMSFEELYDAQNGDFKIFHNGRWVDGRIIRLPKRKMYKIVTSNNKELYVTDNHIFPTLDGDKKVSDLTTNDYLVSNCEVLDAVSDHDDGLTYAHGFIVGMCIESGNLDTSKKVVTISLNPNNYKSDFETIKTAVSLLDPDAECKIDTSCSFVYVVSIASGCVCDFIGNWVSGNYCYDKELNVDCLLQSVDFRNGILDGYYTTDWNNSKIVHTTSSKLVRQMECLITSLGKTSKINTVGKKEEDYTMYSIRLINNKRKNKNGTCAVKVASVETIENYNDSYVYCFEMSNADEPYFTLPNGIISHNCRLLSDTTKLDAFINSIGGTALSIGSVKVNTINLMRIFYETNSEEEYLELLKKRTTLCCKVLDRVRHIISRNIEKGWLPNYQDGGIELSKQYCTVGILGLFEVIEAMGYTRTDEFGNVYYTDKGIDFANRIFDMINEVKDSFTDKYSFNIESVPAERAAVVLCQKDNKLFNPDSDKFIYSNQWIPLTAKCTIQEKLRLSSILDKRCGGGAIAHINLESNFPNTEVAWKMLNKIAKSGVMYFAFNTKINVCKNHHGFIGSTTCPECGEPVFDTYQRIVGFLTPSKSYSKDRFKEFTARRWYAFAESKGDLV